MTLNNLYINERCLEMRAITASLQSAMCAGDLDAIARKVARVAKISDELCNRIHDLRAARLVDKCIGNATTGDF